VVRKINSSPKLIFAKLFSPTFSIPIHTLIKNKCLAKVLKMVQACFFEQRFFFNLTESVKSSRLNLNTDISNWSNLRKLTSNRNIPKENLRCLISLK
jgi:hypothetical protein